MLLELEIESLSYHGGRGIARHESGPVIFVPDTAPGDRIRARITDKKKNYWIGRCLEVLRAGPSRVMPQCPVFGQCGGCDWQHISYDEQVRQKAKILQDCLRPLIKKYGDRWLKSFGASPEPVRYRNRVQLHREGRHLGFFRRSSRELIPLSDCLITELEIAKKFSEVAQDSRWSGVHKIEFARSETGQIDVRAVDTDRTVAVFSQVNSRQNQLLIDHVLGLAQAPTEWSHIWDLYCGNGNFTIPLSQTFLNSKIVGVELSKTNADFGRKKAEALKLSSVHFETQDVKLYLTSTVRPSGTLLVLLDPPRAGMENTARTTLLGLAPDTIVYVSCQPMTLTRDLLELTENGYKLTSLKGFDMFPQTSHIEAVACLRKI